MQIQATLTFDGQCEEAFQLYERCLGGKIVFLMRYSEMPESMGTGPEWEAKVAHASFAGEGFTFSGSDSPPGYYRKPQGIALQVNLKEIDAAERLWAALADGGDVMMPLAETFWAWRFGMLTDRFGTPWMINCEKPMG